MLYYNYEFVGPNIDLILENSHHVHTRWMSFDKMCAQKKQYIKYIHSLELWDTFCSDSIPELFTVLENKELGY